MAWLTEAASTLAGTWDPYAVTFVALTGLWLLFFEQRGLAERSRMVEAAIAQIGGVWWLVYSVVWTVLWSMMGKG